MSRIGVTTSSLIRTVSGVCNANRIQSDTSLGFKAKCGFSFSHCAVISVSTKPGATDYKQTKNSQLRAKAFCQSSQCKLAGNVSRGHWAIASGWYLQSTDIIDVYNDTIVNSWMQNSRGIQGILTLLLHQFQNLLGHASQSKDVDIKDLLPVFHFPSLQCDVNVDGGIVHENVHSS